MSCADLWQVTYCHDIMTTSELPVFGDRRWHNNNIKLIFQHMNLLGFDLANLTNWSVTTEKVTLLDYKYKIAPNQCQFLILDCWRHFPASCHEGSLIKEAIINVPASPILSPLVCDEGPHVCTCAELTSHPVTRLLCWPCPVSPDTREWEWSPYGRDMGPDTRTLVT